MEITLNKNLFLNFFSNCLVCVQGKSHKIEPEDTYNNSRLVTLTTLDSRDSDIRYFVYYEQHGVLKEVHCNTFKKIDTTTICFNNNKIKVKVFFVSPKHIIVSQLRKILPQSFWDNMRNKWTSLSDNFTNLSTSIANVLSVVQVTTHIANSLDLDFLLDMISFIMNMFSNLHAMNTFQICSFLLGFYRIANKIKIKANKIQQDIRGEQVVPHSGIEPFILSAATLLLPKNILEIFKRISLFTSSKVCDDPSVLYNFLMHLKKFFLLTISALPFGDSLINIIENLFSKFGILEHHLLLSRCAKVLLQWNHNKKILMEKTFIYEFQEAYSALSKNINLKELKNKSQNIKSLYEDMERLNKCVEAYESPARVEPMCYIFEGPPGCLKSVTMTMVGKTLNVPIYTHIIKSVDESKDFYDTYNNEQCFMMDDVGQMSISQWRYIINFVSPVKLPLECADAKLKDTKFFNSDMIMLTTNNFSHLHGILKSDCIGDVKALWRRGFVFNMDECSQLHGKLLGKIKIRYFDLIEDRFVDDFPPAAKSFMKQQGEILPKEFICNLETPRVLYLAWIKKVILMMNAMKSYESHDNSLTDEELRTLEDSQYYVTPQCSVYLHTFLNVQKYMKTVISDFASSVTDSVTKLLSSACMMISNFNYADVIPNIFSLCLSAGIMGATSFVIYKWANSGDSCISQMYKRIDKKREVLYKQSTAVEAINRQVFEIDILSDYNGETLINEVCCVISGHLIITVSHAVPGNSGVLTLYKNRDTTTILLDQTPFDVVFRERKSDVVVLRIPPKVMTPFKNLSKFYKSESKGDMWLITPCGPIFLPPRLKPCSYNAYYEIETDGTVVCLNTTNKSSSDYPEAISYDFGVGGLCASPLVTTNGAILGFHVAGNNDSTLCHSIIWRDELRDTIYNILLRDDKYCLDVDISSKDKDKFSGIKLELDAHISTPKNSNYVESPLYGVFPISRVPANLEYSGRHTIKDIENKSFVPVKRVEEKQLRFARDIIDDYIDNFNDISEREIIEGNELLAGLNKDSSNGFACEVNKSYYIDFGNKCFTPTFRQELSELEEKLTTGVGIDPQDIIWYSTLKDELRSEEKQGKPRSFRVSRLHIQVLTKKYFGKMVEHIISNRNFNGIMVGINPFIEFKNMHTRLQMCKGVWAGDIGSYDGAMLPQVQVMINSILLSHYTGPNKQAAEFILTNLPFCLVGINDDVYLTNHSMPSGSFLTAIYNSLVNKAYTAMWFCKNYVGNSPKSYFHEKVIDYVYGDDKLNGVLNNDQKGLNAITMRDFFLSIGMTFTDASKHAITTEYQSMSEVSFLKRNFVYHSTLQQITCPLDVKTLYSGLSWLDASKDYYQVLQDKIHNFQREIFLHEDKYVYDINVLKMKCLDTHIPFNKLPIQYLIKLYKEDPNSFFETSWSKHKYV